MVVRPHICWCPPGAHAAVSRAKSCGDLVKHNSLNHRPEAGSVDSFSPSSSSDDFQSTKSTIPYQGAPGDTKPRADSGIDVSKPRLRGEVSPSKQLLEFCRLLFHHDEHYAYLSFLRAYPAYKLTRSLDTLRKSEYKRLKRSDEVYMDYMGASLYPESLILSNSTFLRQALLGNTHSFSTR